jgi:hypothetical protein
MVRKRKIIRIDIIFVWLVCEKAVISLVDILSDIFIDEKLETDH